jgi:hypothetical protein
MGAEGGGPRDRPPTHNETTTTHDTRQVRRSGVEELAGVEWRVQWRRAGWSAATRTKQRTFRRRGDLDRFVATLLEGDRPEWSPVTRLRVSWRRVGEWQGRGRAGAGDRLLVRCGRPRADGAPCRQAVTAQGDTCRWHTGSVP